jgi:hypothetical protein
VAGRAADVVTKPVLSRTAYIISQADDDEIVTDTSEEIVLAIGSPTPKYQSPSPSKHKATPDKAKEKTSDSTTACLLCGKKNHTVENRYGLRRPGKWYLDPNSNHGSSHETCVSRSADHCFENIRVLRYGCLEVNLREQKTSHQCP